MNSRSRKKGKKPRNNHHRDLTVRDPYASPGYFGPIIDVPIWLPRPVALRVRRDPYPYPLPLQNRLKSRVIRYNLRKPRDLVKTRVRIRVPKQLPLVRGSYVSVYNNRLNIHSRKQHAKIIQKGEYNRRRYSEYKSNRRKARYGQLDSRGATYFGAVAAAAQNGANIDQLADTALAVRAILKGR